jgi:hypothetical protein
MSKTLLIGETKCRIKEKKGTWRRTFTGGPVRGRHCRDPAMNGKTYMGPRKKRSVGVPPTFPRTQCRRSAFARGRRPCRAFLLFLESRRVLFWLFLSEGGEVTKFGSIGGVGVPGACGLLRWRQIWRGVCERDLL